ncbi:MAG: OsmC family protein [Bifidobacteriaceae bacterium]|jgi:uncharacterized OsmC-like protein|nr:OsmC family protein [Bifidobacteriaceae bacterium]
MATDAAKTASTKKKAGAGFPPPLRAKPGLRDFLAHKRYDGLQLAEQREADPPTKPHVLKAHTVAEGRSGVRRIRIRNHQILSDTGPDYAGYNLGPGSPEIVLGALSSCITHITEIVASNRRVPLDYLRVDVRGQQDFRRGSPGFEDVPPEPHQIRFVVTVESPADQSTIDALFAEVQEICPILNLFRKPQTVVGEVILNGERPDEHIPREIAV